MADADRQYASMQASVGSLDPATSDLPVSNDEFLSSFGGAASPDTQQSQLSDPSDILSLVQDPNVSPTAKRNVISSGFATPGVRDALARRLGGVDQSANEEAAGIQQRGDMLQSIFSDAKQSTAQIAQNEASIIKEKQLRASMTAAEYARNLSMRGINLSDINSLVNTSAVDQLDRYQQIMELDRQIKDDQAVSFLDDPVNWLFKQIEVGPKIDARNKVANQYNTTEEYINSASRTAELVRNANAGKLAAMTDTEAQMLAQNKILAGQQDLAKLEEARLRAAGATDKEIRAVNDKAVSQLQTAVNAANADEDRDANRLIREANLATLKSQREAAAAQRELTNYYKNKEMEEKDAQREAQKQQDAFISGALGQFGITTAKQLAAAPPSDKKRYQQLLESYDPIKGYGTFGATPVDVLTNTQNIRARDLNEGQQVMLKSMAALRDKAAQTAMTVPKEQQANVINKAIADGVKKWQDNPTTSGPPYGADGEQVKLFDTTSLVKMAEQPSLGGNAAAIKVNELRAALPTNTPITHEMLVTALAKDVKPGDITPMAEQLAKFYKTGIDANNKMLQPDRFGIDPQRTFNVPLPTEYFGTNKKYDLASVKGATIALAKMSLSLSTDPDQRRQIINLQEGLK